MPCRQRGRLGEAPCTRWCPSALSSRIDALGLVTQTGPPRRRAIDSSMRSSDTPLAMRARMSRWAAEQPLGAHALGDVLEDEHPADDLALLVADRRGADADHDRAPVAADVEHVLVLDDLAGEHGAGQRALVALQTLALQGVGARSRRNPRPGGARIPWPRISAACAVADDDPARRRLGEHHPRGQSAGRSAPDAAARRAGRRRPRGAESRGRGGRAPGPAARGPRTAWAGSRRHPPPVPRWRPPRRRGPTAG